MGNLKVIQYGLGSIGIEISKILLERKGVEIVGIVDKDPEKIKYVINNILGVHKVKAYAAENFSDVSSKTKADVVIHTTSSFVKDVYDQIAECINAGCNVITTAEEMAYPSMRNEDWIKRLDSMAKANGVVVLGTGVNPGFVLDALVIAMTGVCKDIKSITATRVVDLSTRRDGLKKKAGIGLNMNEFEEGVRKNKVGHIGLRESAMMIADAVGVRLKSIDVATKPVLKETQRKKLEKFKNKSIIGFSQKAKGIVGKEEMIKLNLDIYWDAKPYDEIIIKGSPDIKLRIEGGIAGDIATSAIAVNMIPKVMNASPGYKSMKDLPLPSAVLDDFSKFVK